MEHNEPHNLALAVQCAFVGSVFICPQVKKQLSQYVFQSKLKQRQAVAKLAETDRRILALVAQGHTHNTIRQNSQLQRVKRRLSPESHCSNSKSAN